MALGGGTFVTQNKELPGAYINFVSKPRAMGTLGNRGIVALMLNLNWGKEDEVITVESSDFQRNSLDIFGYSFADPELLYIRELFLGARTIKLYRPAGGEKAKVKIGDLTVEALYSGTRGNDIKIIVEQNLDDSNIYNIKTLIGNQNIEVDNQSVSDIKDLTSNSFVQFLGTGKVKETAGANLEGGTNKVVTGNDYSKFLNEIESEDFTTLMYPGENETTKALFANFTKRLRNEEGYKITTVLHNFKADFEGVISVKNEVDGDLKEALVYWTAGQNAGAEVNESLTNLKYNGELKIYTKYKKSEFIEAVQNGEFAFYEDSDGVKVLKDINTFVSFSSEKNKDFANNQVVRVLDEIANGTARIFNNYYLGKAQNDDMGRTLFKVELIKYNEQLQSILAITNFNAEDIVIERGQEKGDVVVNQFVEPVGSMDKLYMTVKVV